MPSGQPSEAGIDRAYPGVAEDLQFLQTNLSIAEFAHMIAPPGHQEPVMLQPHTGPVCDEPTRAAPGSQVAKRGFDWAWVWHSLLSRKWRLATVSLLTVAVYAAGLVRPIFTQRAVDIIAAGTASLELVWLATGALVAIILEAVLTSLRESLVIRLCSFLDRRIS